METNGSVLVKWRFEKIKSKILPYELTDKSVKKIIKTFFIHLQILVNILI